MAKKRRKELPKATTSNEVVSEQCFVSKDLVYLKSAAKFASSQFKKEPKKAEAVKKAFTQLARSITLGETSIEGGKNLELKIMGAGGLAKYRGRQMAVDVGNDRIRAIVVPANDNELLVANVFIKRGDNKDYERECKKARDQIVAYKGGGIPHNKVFPDSKVEKPNHTNKPKSVRF